MKWGYLAPWLDLLGYSFRDRQRALTRSTHGAPGCSPGFLRPQPRWNRHSSTPGSCRSAQTEIIARDRRPGSRQEDGRGHESESGSGGWWLRAPARSASAAPTLFPHIVPRFCRSRAPHVTRAFHETDPPSPKRIERPPHRRHRQASFRQSGAAPFLLRSRRSPMGSTCGCPRPPLFELLAPRVRREHTPGARAHIGRARTSSPTAARPWGSPPHLGAVPCTRTAFVSNELQREG